MIGGEEQISMITWQDAAFSFEDSIPATAPEPRVIFGIILHETAKYIFISTEVYRDQKTKEFIPVDGMLIPRGAIREIRHLTKFYD
ncbi:MAG TPA: hypothetical protein VMV38_00990 [Candidatus Paceibacterota bacterium]|nr:hypothetical protein [Candidatus Paceibacterota bacterium]